MKRIVPVMLLVGSLLSVLNAQMYDPFKKTAKTPAVSVSGLLPPPPMAAPLPPPIVVTAVMNDRAFINGAWYRIGERVNGHEITYIDPHFVGLREGPRLKMVGVGSARRVLGTKDTP